LAFHVAVDFPAIVFYFKNKDPFFRNHEKVNFRSSAFTVRDVNVAKDLVFGNVKIVY